MLCWSLAAPIAAIQDARQLKVATFHSPPFAIIDSKAGLLNGISIDVVNRMAAVCRVDIDYVVVPAFSRGFRGVQDGTVDAIVPILKSTERERILLFSAQPVGHTDVAIVVNQDSAETRFTGMDMLEGKRVGRLSSGSITPEFDAYLRKNKFSILERHSYQALVENLVFGRLDYIAGPLQIFEFHAAQLEQKTGIRALQPSLKRLAGFVALSRVGHVKFPKKQPLYDCFSTVILDE